MCLLLIFQASCSRQALNAENKQPDLASLEEDKKGKEGECRRFDFRFLTLFEGQLSPTVYKMRIFLDERAFSQKNLTELFRHLSKKQPNAKILTVEVLTNWEQLEPGAFDCEGMGISGAGRAGEDEFRYHKALFKRFGDKAFYTFNPILNTSKEETINIKGPMQ